MKLGDTRKLQQVDHLVMRVRVEEPEAGRNRIIYAWRGVALDSFDGLTLKRSDKPNESFSGGERVFIQLGTPEAWSDSPPRLFYRADEYAGLFGCARAVAAPRFFASVNRGKDER